MAVDEPSSQDSTLIDDDLVAALGFEPVTTVETSNGDIAVDDIDVVDDLVIDDLVVDEAPMGDISTIGGLDGFVIDEVDETGADEIGADVLVDEISADEISADDVEVDDVEIVDVEVDDVEIVDVEVDDVEIVDVEVDDVETIPDDVEIVDVDVVEVETIPDEISADDVEVDDEVIASDLDAVPSISDDDLDVDATAPVALVDLDLDTDDVTTEDLDASDVDATDLDDLSPYDLDATDLDDLDGDVIDLDTVDLSDPGPDKIAADERSTQGFADAEVHELADADSVFADATPVLDPPAFDDPIGLPATETVGQVGSGFLDLDTAEETAGAAAVATASTATATKGRRRLRARKSRRVIRHIDPWSVLTFSVLFHMVVFAALLLSSVLVWNAAIASGMVENIESFIQELGDYETFEINADVMFRSAIVIAGMLTLASSVLVVLLTVVFNLISDLVGGIRVTVIEEETVRVPIDKKRSKARNE